MKNNTNDVKNYLRQALMSVPDDFNLQDVKSHINKALSVVESVEKKRFLPRADSTTCWSPGS